MLTMKRTDGAVDQTDHCPGCPHRSTRSKKCKERSELFARSDAGNTWKPGPRPHGNS
jgi:hypothetical protein